MSIERYGILNDVHMPFEDRQRYELALKIMKDVSVNRIYLNGDIAEFMSISAHPKHPGDSVTFPVEIDYLNKKFDELIDLFPGIPVTLLEGNHCYRFFRYIRDVAPQMWGLIDCPAILKFPDRIGWRFVPYGPDQLVKCGESNLYLRHEPLGGGATHAKATAEASYIDIAYGHTHQFQIHTHKKYGPKPIFNKAYSLGWLGDVNRRVFDYRPAKASWVTGMTIIECETTTGDYSLEFIDLRTIPVLYRGKRYDAKD